MINKNRIAPILLTAVLGFAGLASLGAAHEEKSAEKKTLVGHVVGVACYFGHGSIGDSHRECATTCAKGGIPLAILDQESNTLYLPLANDHHAPANKELMPFIEQGVRMTGTVVEKDGMKAITLESVSKAD